jgi:hypothetical protein
MIYALDGHSAYQLRSYLPMQWRTRVSPVFYGQDGRMLRSEEGRWRNLWSTPSAWIVISPQLLSRYLDASFGPAHASQLALHAVATFDKPGGHTQLALYQVLPR